ncbi:MAG: leucine-rich repeat protein, partial [Hominenteromicrobium sp.]
MKSIRKVLAMLLCVLMLVSGTVIAQAEETAAPADVQTFAEDDGAVVQTDEADAPADVQTFAEDDGVVASGTCGENLTWVLDEDGVLTISGTGRMEDFDIYFAPWHSYQSSIITAIIEDGVTNIACRTFCDCSTLRNISIPESVTSIDYGAFYDCSALTDVYYGGSEEQWAAMVMTIGSGNDALLNAAIHYNVAGIVASGTCGENLTWTL